MKLYLKSPRSINDTTISPLLVDCEYECDILEDRVREIPGDPVVAWKVDGKTAIPAGQYKIIINLSPRFGKMLPLLIGVPGFDGVRIHGGNDADDTDGCLLTGTRAGDAEVVNSQIALAKLQGKIQAAIDAGDEVWITIERTFD